VSKRTIFAYYQSKEDILFCDDASMYEKLERVLTQRPPGVTTVDALRELLAAIGPADEQMLLRKKSLAADASLRLSERARFARVQRLLAESIARDLGAGPDDVRPVLIAASVTAAWNTAHDRLIAQSPGATNHEDAAKVLEFLPGGLQALQQQP
jgi:AcrR family transcriptional regulator